MNANLMLLILAGGVLYALACVLWPFAPCWRCHGDGKLRSPSGKAWRRCKRCKGTGRRIRAGRWILSRWTVTTRKAKRWDDA